MAEKSKGGSIWAGVLGGLGVCLIVILILCWCAPVEIGSVHILKMPTSSGNPEEVSMTLDSLKVQHVEALRDLEDKGLLLTPSDYTSHISSFYSTLVAVLVGIFVLFSFLSFFIIRENSNRQVKEIKDNLDEEISTKILAILTGKVRDSKEFHELIHAGVESYVKGSVAKQEDVEAIQNMMEAHNNSLAELFSLYMDLEDGIGHNEVIE